MVIKRNNTILRILVGLGSNFKDTKSIKRIVIMNLKIKGYLTAIILFQEFYKVCFVYFSRLTTYYVVVEHNKAC